VARPFISDASAQPDDDERDPELPRFLAAIDTNALPIRRDDNLEHDRSIETLALRIFPRVVEPALGRACPAAGSDSRIGAVAFYSAPRISDSDLGCALP